MGQNDSKQIQTTVSSLEIQKIISHSQAQKFLHDYHTNHQSVKDVKQFDDNRLHFFLKYFILHKYRATQTLLTKRTKTNHSGGPVQNRYDQLMGTLCFETQKVEQRMTKCHLQINSFILYEGKQMFLQMIKNTLSELGIEQLILRMKDNQQQQQIVFKKQQNFFKIEPYNGQSLSKILSHKYKFRKLSKADMLKEKYIQSESQLDAQQFYVEEIITKQKYILMIVNFSQLMSITKDQSQILNKIEKLSSALTDFIDQILKFYQFYQINGKILNEDKQQQNQGNFLMAEVCWNVLKINKTFFDFQHTFFIHKLISEFKTLLHLTSNDFTLKHIKSRVQQLFNKKQKSHETDSQVIQSFNTYEKKYLKIKNSLSDYLQKYFKAISQKVLEFEFDQNTELKVLVASGDFPQSRFLFDEIRQIVERQANPTLSDVFRQLESFKQFYKNSYQESLKNPGNMSVHEHQGLILQFSFRDELLQNIRISISFDSLIVQYGEKKSREVNNQGLGIEKMRVNGLQNGRKNEKQGLNQLIPPLVININSKKNSSKNSSVLDLDDINLSNIDSDVNILDLELNLLAMDKQSLPLLAIRIMQDMQFYQTNLSQNHQMFVKFLSFLKSGYQQNNNPFHNFTHGVNVMHTSFLLCSNKQIRQSLSSFSRFVLVFSALCHDIGHTGYSNAFQIATQSNLAETYNDNSPLENYHIHRTFAILKYSSCNFIDSLTSDQKIKLRKLMISNILNTDVKEHFNVLKKFDEKKGQFKKQDLQDEKIICGMLIHSSDFGGSIKDFRLCKIWSQMVNEQFKNQSLKEKELNIPLSPFMVNLDNPLVMAKNEMGFLKFMVQPLFKSISETFTNEMTKKILQRVNNNITQWEMIIKSLN